MNKKYYTIEFLGFRKDGVWMTPYHSGSSDHPSRFLPGFDQQQFDTFEEACEYMWKNIKGADEQGISAVFCVPHVAQEELI